MWVCGRACVCVGVFEAGGGRVCMRKKEQVTSAVRCRSLGNEEGEELSWGKVSFNPVPERVLLLPKRWLPACSKELNPPPPPPHKPLVDSATFMFFFIPTQVSYSLFPLSHFSLHVCFSSFVLCLKFSLCFSSGVSDLETPPLLLLLLVTSYSPHSLRHALLCVNENNINPFNNVLPPPLITDV